MSMRMGSGRGASGVAVALAAWLAASAAAAQMSTEESERAFFGGAAVEAVDPSDVAAVAARAETRIAAMLDEARAQRDIIHVTCLNDKLTQVRAAIATIERRNGDRASAHERAVARAVRELIGRLVGEAEQCVGQDLFSTGTVHVVAETAPSIEIDAATRRSSANTRETFAQAAPRAPALPQGAGGGGQATPSDGAPILVYRASVSMSVHAVEERQAEVLALARELGGHLHEQSEDAITARGPAPRFEEALERIDAIGDVLARRVQVQDVGDEHRDLHIRLQNAEHTRDRLLALLERASAVDDVLAVQRELERVTLEIEQLRARLRFLDDRIAMSMIRVAFQPAPREGVVDDDFRLPVPWLDDIGLGSLLRFPERQREWDEY